MAGGKTPLLPDSVSMTPPGWRPSGAVSPFVAGAPLPPAAAHELAPAGGLVVDPAASIAQDYVTRQPIRLRTDDEGMDRLIGFSGVTTDDNGGAFTHPAVLSDRIHVMIQTPTLPPGVTGADVEFGIFNGMGCIAVPTFIGTFHVSPGGLVDFAQVSGLLTEHWELGARLTPGLGQPDRIVLTVRVHLVRAGGGFQIFWGDGVNNEYPVGPPLSNIHLLP